MNKDQKNWLYIGVVVACLMMLAPPWKSETDTGTFREYGCVFDSQIRLKQIDVVRLGVQLGVVGLVTAALIVSTSVDRKDRRVPESVDSDCSFQHFRRPG